MTSRTRRSSGSAAYNELDGSMSRGRSRGTLDYRWYSWFFMIMGLFAQGDLKNQSPWFAEPRRKISISVKPGPWPREAVWRNQRGGVIAAGVTALVALAGMLAGPGYTAAPTLPTDKYADTDAAARTTATTALCCRPGAALAPVKITRASESPY